MSQELILIPKDKHKQLIKTEIKFRIESKGNKTSDEEDSINHPPKQIEDTTPPIADRENKQADDMLQEGGAFDDRTHLSNLEPPVDVKGVETTFTTTKERVKMTPLTFLKRSKQQSERSVRTKWLTFRF